MVRARLGRLAANVLMVVLLAIAAPAGAEEQGAADVAALNKQVLPNFRSKQFNGSDKKHGVGGIAV
jgi:hypothetical protein